MLSKIGYRVFEFRINGYYSAAIGGHGDVRCTIGEWATPSFRCGPFTLFTALEEAKTLIPTVMGSSRDLKVLEVEYVPSTEQHVFTRDLKRTSFLRLEPGTRLADAIKPIRVVFEPREETAADEEDAF